MRLRSTLVFSIVSLLLATVLLVAGSAYVSARRSAAKLTEDVLAQAIERIDRVVRAQLEVAASESRFMAALFRRGVVRTDDLETIARYETDVIASHPSLSYVSFGEEATGEFAQASRNGADEVRVRFLRRRDDHLEVSDYAPEHGGLRLLQTTRGTDANLPQSRPYYAKARDAKRPVWTETYAFFGEEATLGAPGVTLATPIASDDALMGVLTADFDLHATSATLTNLGLFEHGRAFLVEYRKDGARRVIAHPKPELLARRTATSGEGSVAAVTVEDIADRDVTTFGRSLPSTLPEQPGRVTPVRFEVDGARYVGGFRALHGGDLRWVICAFVPEEDVLGEVHKNDRRALALIVLGTVSAILLALWIGARIATPLRAVADETEAVGKFQLDLHALPESGVLEVRRLAQAVEEMKRNLRSFRKYVPSEVVRTLVANGEEAKLGGERAVLTIHFSDIAGFTTIAEKTSPEALVAMLGEYLDEMTRPILASGGTVDKFIGDAVMAFWGAPRADREHALHACEVALTNRDRLAVLNARWELEGRPRLDARAALHTGEVIVGNIGSQERLEYTIIGDSVNLASRLEGLNKRYGTSLIISGTTYALVEHVMVARRLDRVSVKGKTIAVDIYELLGRKGEVPEERIAHATRYGDALELYMAREFERAATILRELSASDVAAADLLMRCEAFAKDPPGPEWTGTEDMRTK